MTSAFNVAISPDGIAELKFDLAGEKVNKFSLAVLDELEGHLDRLATTPGIKVMKLTSGKEEVFIAGADLHGFEPAFEDPPFAEKLMQTGHRVFDKLQNLPFPTVAVIHGACLGGGLECALSCTYRIVSDHPKTILGLPEVNLGIFPGWGGTQRLPRLIGLTEGLNMILPGKTVPAMKAWKMHIADAILPWQFLPAKTDEFIQLVLSKDGPKKINERRATKSWTAKLLESNPAGRALIFSQSKKAVLEKTKGHYPAPLIALDVIKKTYTLPLPEGLKIERETFIASIPEGFSLAKYLIGIFFTQEAAKKDTGLPKDVKGVDVKSAAVIGAGTMGAGLAWILADHHIFTRLKDISWEVIGRGMGTIKSLFDKGLKAKKISVAEHDLRLQLISGTIDYSGFQHADFVIEAATENLDLKRKIFHEIESSVGDQCIIASNTSSLTIADMCQEMKHPERFVGMHFFNPVHKMPLVEVVAGSKTSQESVATVVNLAFKLGKTPIIVGDCAGFLVNRILMQGANEVVLMLEEGYTMETLEKTLSDFGMPMGPFTLTDEVGNDVTYKVTLSLEKAYGERFKPAELMKLMYDRELFGRKNGKGFYLYKGQKKTVNPEIVNILNAMEKPHKDLPQEEIVPRFLYAMINEASRCLEEKIILRADFLDLALILGIGFPPFRGGLLRYADHVGVENVVADLKRFEKAYGMRFKPCNLIENMAENHKNFYE